MTDEQIIKAFKCITYGEIDKCLRCPYDVYKECETFVYEDALDLIKRQQAEIDRLKMLFNDQQEIIADLEWTVENEGFKHLGKMYSELRAEAIKEFAEKLNSGFSRYHIYNGSYVLGLIEAVAKGMVGNSNA